MSQPPPSGLISSIKHANSDMLANTAFQLVGIPSGTKLSAAELTVEYKTSNILGLYPMGEGAGYAGGIMSSAIDGIKTAEKIIMKYKSFENS